MKLKPMDKLVKSESITEDARGCELPYAVYTVYGELGDIEERHYRDRLGLGIKTTSLDDLKRQVAKM